MSRYLGIDYGTRRIGLAVGEPGTGVVSPLRAVESRNDPGPDAESVLRTADDYAVVEIVVGLPMLMDGTEGDEARRVRRLADAMKTRTSLPVHLFDERLTTFAADLDLRDRQLTRNQKRDRRDGLAATHILSAYFERLARGGSPDNGE